MNKPETVLDITDSRPLAFYGNVIAQATSRKKHAGNRKQGRWTNVFIYVTVPPTRPGYCVGIANLTCHIGEKDKLMAEYFTTLDEVTEMVYKLVPELADEISGQLHERNNSDRQKQSNKAVLKS